MKFRAFVVSKDEAALSTEVKELEDSDLPPGEVLIRVHWSALNYKDAMVTQPGNRVVRRYPLIPGVDLAGVVEESEDTAIPAGSRVLVQGYGLGVSHDGGFSELARVPADWIVPIPEPMTGRDAMIVGTAGFTAVLSLRRLEMLGISPGNGPV